jgi:hypothetical protein
LNPQHGPRLLLGIGLILGTFVLYEMTSLTPHISEWMIVGVGQGCSTGFVSTPLSVCL